MIAIENAKRMAVLPEEDVLNIHLIQELRRQRNKLNRWRGERLFNPVKSGIQKGAQIPPVSID